MRLNTNASIEMLVPEKVIWAAEEFPENVAYKFLENGIDVSESLTYKQLNASAVAIAQQLKARKLSGRPAALVTKPGAHLPVILLAMMLAGMIIAPLPEPKKKVSKHRFSNALGALKPAVIISDTASYSSWSLDSIDVPVLLFEELQSTTQATEGFNLPQVTKNSLAFIQYSSGSTAEPKGVALSHNNIAANINMIHIASDVLPGEVVLSWLPHTHDMGLFGAIIAPLSAGATIVQVDPNTFLYRPSCWMTAASKYRANHIVAPNFGYDLAVRRHTKDNVKKLDLSSIKRAFIGAEPIKKATLDSFAFSYSIAGFDVSAFVSCYGLAESTLISTVGFPEIIDKYVSCGSAVDGAEVHIFDQQNFSNNQKVGQVYISGEHVSLGLWQGENLPLLPYSGEKIGMNGKRLVPTGDLGWIDSDRLVVVDRFKDTIPVRGGTLGAIELENEAMSISNSIHAAAAVSFDVEEKTTIGIAIEVNKRKVTEVDLNNIKKDIIERVAREFGVKVNIFVFKPWQLPRTTSGKIRRFLVRTILSDCTEIDNHE